MSTAFEAPAQYERDLRSASKEWKRTKDSNAKWLYGSRPLSGIAQDLVTGEPLNGSDSQHQKARPKGKFSEEHPRHNANKKVKEHNITKLTRGNYEMPAGRVRGKQSAVEAINDDDSQLTQSISDLLPAAVPAAADPKPTLARKMSASAENTGLTLSGVLYSFDRADTPATPGRPLTLDVFVKTTGRETERLVEREYEIVDGNGELLRGRKARKTLRRPLDSGLSEEPVAEEDEGFELV